MAGGLVERHPDLGQRSSTGGRPTTTSGCAAPRCSRCSARCAAGGGDFGRFSRYADAMLAEREFFIRKAIGWVLREVARRRPELVAAWLGPRVHLASGVTVREAVKPLSEPIRAALLIGIPGQNPDPLGT